ncbi:TraR/DksA C4-type zinc finger protein [Shewanella eurypsychrophilus]|uniref:TraR/DksA C4-type zinc finger protein n=1 Tax=Shewanella eurypsychrophilus TaxID=2593656 RepID=A0ABX6V4H7_9GAMM|nr:MULTISPECIES: TraR/DksA C4-type zinc finger protein [Shewanella]QFU22269.1 TraR/DksA family transcriptional regulator [Shewanella sp. YLB-09]QPG57555.1 TraR/DksA C4-type zinc finger protein [Shewanella eurypsychrophilus]
MSHPQIRHELSKIETNLRIEIGQLAERKQIGIDSQGTNLCELIALLTNAALSDHPLFSQLTKLDAAFCQLDIGLYGLCSDCESEIEPERLILDPVEQRCALCAESYAHEHRHELRLTH